METVFKIILLLNVIALALCGGEPPKDSPSPPRPLGRQGRKNYGVYRPTRDYGDEGDEKDDSDDDSEPPRPPQQPPSSGNDYPNFNTYKGYNQFPSYDPIPQIPNTYKGYPFYAPYWKGGPKPADSAPASPAQMMEMMMAMNAMTDDAKPEDGGIISKLVSDPKSVAAAAIIPLSIVLAATVPVFMNYMMTAPTPLVSTTATGSKEARNLDHSHGLDNVLENIARFARALDSDDCIQKTICRVAQGESNAPGSDYIKKAANAVASLVKEEWVDNLGVKHLVEGLKHGNCADVCSGGNSRPRE